MAMYGFLKTSGPDATSLDRLRDIIVPPLPWWQPTVGWLVLAAAVLVVLISGNLLLIQRHRMNLYRRQAPEF